MFKKVIICITVQYNLRDQERFGAQMLTKLGYKVEVWDFSLLFNQRLREKWNPRDPLTPDLEIASWKDFFRAYNQVNNTSTLMVPYFNLTIKTILFFMCVSRGLTKQVMNVSNIPIGLSLEDDKPKKSIFAKIGSLTRIIAFHPLSLLDLLLDRYFFLLKISPPDFIICGGALSRPAHGHLAKSKVVWAHHLDYERARSAQVTPPEPLLAGEYGVFLDNGTPFHPDNYIYGTEIPKANSAEVYYPSVNTSLGQIEDKLGLKIAIAAHPRWNFRNYPNPYQGRPIFGDLTETLVKHAKFVVGHRSTALSYAIIFKKPVIFIESSCHTESLIAPTARVFKKRSYPIYSDFGVLKDELNIDEAAYNQVIDKYIRLKQQDGHFWEIFFKFAQ